MQGNESVEFTGKTVDEAVEKALAALGKTREQVEITVLSEGSRGLLGIGGESARVAVRVLPEPARPEPKPAPPPAAEKAGDDALVAVAKETLETIIRLMGVQARVEVLRDVELPGVDQVPFVLNIQADEDLGILIGRRAETLSALQYLTRLIVGHKTKMWSDFAVDVQSYRVRRGHALQNLARRMAERVQETHRAVALEAMPPAERRIVHLALRDHPHVVTQSIGEGENRKVMILPKE
ncbi:MAG: RNA-binding cell elongation regulator Jag/EloR [Anaerolineae bacterium]|nr:RNA-binding cell elongation regulator Jag/EloR [Anaerolineae bacterium]